ncbi:MAG TPA: Sir2 family NAD-dependent protein deacetylase, partial [Clostridia bacterium]|nr:Sir2 family NAD-dependent protein deacetylase [Clostridia bacterium]
MEHAISKLKALLDISRHIVFLGGAGVSTESGIPDFRSRKAYFQRSNAMDIPLKP